MLSQTTIVFALLHLAVYSTVPQFSSKAKDEVGQILVKNALAFKSDQIRRKSGIRPGQLVNDQMIDRAVERIRTAYLQSGYLEVEVSIRKDAISNTLNKRRKIVNLHITINEGLRFFIRRTEVTGNFRTNHNVVMGAAGGIRPGQCYNPLDIEKWLRGLNRLGRFEPVNKENIEINIDKQGHFVDLLFHVKEKFGLRIRRK